ncbi:MAG: hypothetical protein PHY92_10880 [Alphaproteobacteria bacterium]|nr:hypothetical protein [Alphaproteobacteria bacterium]
MPKSLRPKTFSLMAVGVAGLLLAACVSGKPAPDTYTSPSGAVTAIESDRDACIRSCNNDYERCGDMLSSTRNDVGAQPMGRTFGVGSDCRDALQSCLPRCKGR